MDVRNIAVVVEDVDAARTALQWALNNIIRYGDIITLLHVFPFTRSRNTNKARLLRLKGFQLALSFQHICNNFSNTKVEIVVTEDNQEGMKIVATVREIGASVLVVGLHHHSFLYKMAMAHNNVASYFNCRVFAIKQPHASPLSPMVSAVGVLDSSTNMDFSQIDLSRLHNWGHNERYIHPIKVSNADSSKSLLAMHRRGIHTPPPKVKYRICPDPAAIICIWRLRRSRKR